MCEHIFHSDKEKTLKEMKNFLINSSAAEKIINEQVQSLISKENTVKCN